MNNPVFQIEKILFAPKEKVEQNFYMTDYRANLFSMKFNEKKISEIPMLPLKIASIMDDLLQKRDWKYTPFTTFRLNNLTTKWSIMLKIQKYYAVSKEEVVLTTKWIKGDK